MSPQAALIELLERVGVNQGAAILISVEELGQWPSAAVKAMKTQRLLAKARAASSAICPGCERECMMPVHTLTATTGGPESFIVCDKRSDINRVSVAAERLIRWRCNADIVCGFVAASLGLRRSDKQTISADLWEIGIAIGAKRSQMLCLQFTDGSILVVGNNKIPLAELVNYHDGKYSLDSAMIRRMVDTSTTGDERYTPSKVKSESRNMDTQAIYDSWKKECRRFKKEHPDMSEAWIASKIAKSEIGKGRSADTIRKNMKK